MVKVGSTVESMFKEGVLYKDVGGCGYVLEKE